MSNNCPTCHPAPETPKKERPVTKTEGCEHLNTKTKFGIRICLDCHQVVS
jgi:hypothetical protein